MPVNNVGKEHYLLMLEQQDLGQESLTKDITIYVAVSSKVSQNRPYSLKQGDLLTELTFYHTEWSRY